MAGSPNIVTRSNRSFSFKCALHARDREISSVHDFHLLGQEETFISKLLQCIALKFLFNHRDRKYYAENYKFCPPPLFMLSVTIIQFACFLYQTITHNGTSEVPMDSIFIYRPDKRNELWRYFLYMLIHAGWFHLAFNLIMQMLIGIPLEMVHSSTRIACIYLAGVLAGSLGTSILDPGVYLVGASGGVYALLAAHLANIMLNYSNMEYGIFRLIGILLFASVDVGFAIYSRYEGELVSDIPSVSFVAHLTGAVAGLTIGLVVLKNFEQKLHEQLLFWIALGIYLACVAFAVVFNIINSVSIQKLREETDSIMKNHINRNY